MATVEQVKPMTLAGFIRMYDDEGPFEYVNGERIALSPNVTGHIVVARALLLALHNYAVSRSLGEVFMEGPFVLMDSSNWVKGSRVPDIMYFSAERLSTYKASTPDWRDKPFLIVPDLAVEILSPSDRFGDVHDKVTGYLADGVQMVWVINRQEKTVQVHRQGSAQYSTLFADGTLDGGTLIPGFTLPVAKLFE